MGARVINRSFSSPPAGMIPRRGQPCLRGDVLWVVLDLGADARRPTGIGRDDDERGGVAPAV